ncbi:MAG: hypothetical protein IPP57_23015 [Candidatus Obscuribacter sp.]|jgi:hypothetical protein|nr:hypothetical protein [Candidatus Obscuribacter sp.]MDQ5964029.1 hypothetical protein [Cyanobacteriota bacterium erpe_2018_sw_39hr_WHONDRS-SW48-000098_B_bin.30]MBK7838733.1 hypothetical protein [Candidatus Obscuribacter sp.]MBK9202634.1 hypothetical protein [Candidatus Obscuribacter sp.]MBK9621263.1 hypothetical protein [Candidatus Obscuribacter sp.]
MNSPSCSTVKSALTDLREILSRFQASGISAVETGTIIANLEATINCIEEKSLAQNDIPEERGMPIITGLTSLAI